MSEEDVFFKQAAEAIVATSLNISNVDPTIQELLKRIKSNEIDFSAFSHNLQGTESAPSHRGSSSSFLSAHGTVPFDNPISPSPYIDDLGSNNGNSPSNHESVTLIPSAASNGNPNIPREDILSTQSIFSSFMGAAGESPQMQEQRQQQLHLLQQQHQEQQQQHSPADSVQHEAKPKTTKPKKSHGESTDKKYPCSQCDLVFFRSSDLRRHEKAHSLILPHICSQCGKGFARKDALKRHQDTLTCKRNRNKLMEITNGKVEEFLERAKKEGISL